MGEVDFTLALTAGAFLLASWVEAKIGDSRPESPVRRLGHAVVSFVLLQTSVGALYLVKGAGAGPEAVMAAVLLLFVPALVYAFVAGLWMLRALVEISRFARR